MDENKEGNVMIKNLGILREYFLVQGAQRLVELGMDYTEKLLTGKATPDGEHMNQTFSVYVLDLFVSEDFETIEKFLDVIYKKAEEGGTAALFEIVKEQLNFLKKVVEEDE